MRDNRSAFFFTNMAKAQFTNNDINEAIDAFVANTAPRTAPAAGKNGEVLIYGENANPYKPVIPKAQEDEDVEFQTPIA